MPADMSLGQLLVAAGIIDAAELSAVLSLQADLRAREGIAPDAVAERFRLGRLLVESGVIDQQTLEKALHQSKRTGQKLGESLVEAGAISSELLQSFLDRQRRMVALALAGVALSSAVAAPATAADGARVQIVASVLSRSSIDSRDLPSEVTVSSHDVALGYIDVKEPVEVTTRSNRPGGLMLAFSANSSRIAQVDVIGADGSSVAGNGMLFVAQSESGLRRQTVRLKLRLRLAPDAVPGRIPFPVAVSLVPA